MDIGSYRHNSKDFSTNFAYRISTNKMTMNTIQGSHENLVGNSYHFFYFSLGEER